jgi:hypothetical protein
MLSVAASEIGQIPGGAVMDATKPGNWNRRIRKP